MHIPAKAETSVSPSVKQSACPVTGGDSATQSSSSTLSKLNPLNYMFSNISQDRAPEQSIHLPTQRTTSSIPKGGQPTDGNWEYPSPQQMYNAMLRKGYTDTPIDAVEAMVEVHNFLNEGAWADIVEWERRFSNGLWNGWKACSRGEDGSMAGAMMGTGENAGVQQPRLVRFMGRPKDRTPRATMLQWMGWVYPEKFG